MTQSHQVRTALWHPSWLGWGTFCILILALYWWFRGISTFELEYRTVPPRQTDFFSDNGRNPNDYSLSISVLNDVPIISSHISSSHLISCCLTKLVPVRRIHSKGETEQPHSGGDNSCHHPRRETPSSMYVQHSIAKHTALLSPTILPFSFLHYPFPSCPTPLSHRPHHLPVPLYYTLYAAMFGLIEGSKTQLRIQEYSIAQTSLEQIFNQFAAQQEEEKGPAAGLS